MSASALRDPALRRARVALGIFIAGLVLSGATALPLRTEAGWLLACAGPDTPAGDRLPALAGWIETVHDGLAQTEARHPFIAYGTDWLAFAHFVLALAFVGPWRDPRGQRWLIDFGLLACALVIPFACVAGAVRGIPWFWRGIDCAFGVAGAVPLLVVRRALTGQRRLAR